MKKSSATLQDVANLAGVSVSTVSRILKAGSGVEIPFAEKTQAKVRRASSQLGYRPSKLARGLVGSRTNIVGLVVPSLEDSFFTGITAALQKRLNESSYDVLIASTEHNSSIEQASIEDFLSWRADGLIVAPSQKTSDAGFFWELWRLGVPFVLVDRFFYDTPFASVTTDDHAGGMMAVEHLVSLGRRKIARAGSSFSVSTSRLRHSGYLDALTRHGVEVPAGYVLECEPTIADGRKLVDQLLKLKPRPDALFCFTDIVAIGVIEECTKQGIKIPDDLAVVGYADLEFCSFARVPLTTIRQSRSEIGLLAAETLIDQMAGKEIKEPQIVLPVELVVRESTVGTGGVSTADAARRR